MLARFDAGEPVLYYTWTPMWLGGVLVPGQDTVWLDVPFSSGPDGDVNTEAADGSNTGFEINAQRIVANNDFLADNPAAAALFEAMSIPLDDVSAQNLIMNEGEDSTGDIARHATEWIAANRDVFDGWLETARAAA